MLTTLSLSAIAFGQKGVARIGVAVLPAGGGQDAGDAAYLVSEAGLPTVHLVPIAPLHAKLAEDPKLAALVEKARALELELKFRDAAAVWHDLVDRLTHSAALVLDPGRIAKAQVALAAAYAEAGEPDLAVLELREALAFDAGTKPGPTYPPKVRALFERAVSLGPALPATPGDALLERVATAAHVDGVLWVAVGREGGKRVLVRRLHFAHAPDTSAEVRTVLPENDDAARQAVAREAVTLRGTLATRFPEPPPPPPKATPWYRKGWFIGTAVGVAGAVVAGVVIARTLGTDRVTVVVKH